MKNPNVVFFFIIVETNYFLFEERYYTMMIVLGIEGTAHSIAVGVIQNDKNFCTVRSNIVKTYHPEKGGIHPREAANHHTTHVASLIQQSLAQANVSFDDIDLVAFSQGPGLGPCLRTAATAARSLSLRLDVPLIGVNHCVAHLEIGRGTIPACKDPVLLYVSGANTQIISFAEGKYRVFGETLDIGIGNCLDKFGRTVGFEFPAGPKIEQEALASTNYQSLPYTVKGMDIAFSGLLTAAEQLYQKGVAVSDLCYSLQETAFAALVEVTERAVAHTEKNEILLGGGVASNTRLREMVASMAKERNAAWYVPKKSLCIDNGAMIAWLGYLMYQSGIRMPVDHSTINQRFRTEMVEVTWRE